MAEFEFLNAGNSEAQEKGALSVLFAQSGAWMAATGVLDGLVVTQTPTASGSVLIASGSAVVQPTITAGASLLVNPSQKTLDIFTANPVGGLPRNDIIEFDSLTALISVRVGVPNATPTDPTVPATSDALARLRHAASATTIPTAKIDQLQVPTTLRQPPTPIMPHVRVRAATAVSRAGGAWNAAPLDTLTDASGVAVATVSGYQVNILTAGLYNLAPSVSMSGSSGFAVRLLNNSTTEVLASTQIESGIQPVSSVSVTRRLAAGTGLLLQVYPTSTLSTSVDGGLTPTSLSVTRLSD